MSVEAIVFFVCALICIGGAFGVIWSRNPVHSALSLVATLFGIAVLFLNQNAQLLAAVQVIVYTGAIVVLIMFVIMLLGVDREEDIYTEPLVGQRFLAFLVGLLLFGVLFGVLMLGGTKIVTGQPNCSDGKLVTVGDAYEPACKAVDENLATASVLRPNVNQIGRVLFTDFVLAFEITAALLTIAVVGAVLLSRRPTDVQPIPEIEDMDYENVDEIETDRGRLRMNSGSLSTGYLVLGAMLFALGTAGLLRRRNPLVMLMCLELMLNAINLTFVTFGRMLNDVTGQVIVFFVLVVAAAEVVIGLGIVVAIARRRPGATADDISVLRG